MHGNQLCSTVGCAISQRELMFNYSELLGKSRQASVPSLSPAIADSVDTETIPALRHIPVDEVDLQPESRVVILTDPRSPGAAGLDFSVCASESSRLWES